MEKRSGAARRWLAAVVGLLSTVLGVFLVFNPFYSLAVLIVTVVVGLALAGISELTDLDDSPDRRVSALVGVLLLVGAGVVALWPGLGIGTLAILLGVSLIAEGVIKALAGIRGTTDQRLTCVVAGLTAVILGILALAWPDVSVFVVAVLFGIRLVMYGVRQIWGAVRGTRAARSATASPLHRFARTAGALVALALALVLVAVSAALHRGEPVPDAFYTPPTDVSSSPGQLLRTEPFTRGIPTDAKAWRILYTTTRDASGTPAVASALVVVGRDAPSGPRPVLAWAHGTTGYEPSCAPTLAQDPLGSGAMPALDDVIAQGWILVATDYVGLGTSFPHPYLIGQGEARSVIDAVRAARDVPHVTASQETVVWGHSQGGNAALWTGVVQPGYAPDVPLSGVAALAPASDLPGLVGNLDDVTGGSLFASYVLQAYSDTYSDVDFDAYVRPAARIQIREMAARCLAEPEVFVSVVESLMFGQSIFDKNPATGALGARLEENTPDGAIPAPLLIGQGEADPLVLPSAQAAYVARRCAQGGVVDYRTYPGRDHVGVVADDSPLVPQLVEWTKDRFAGMPARSNCPQK